MQSSQGRKTRAARYSRARSGALRRKARVTRATRSTGNASAEIAVKEPTRCRFGATRVGALLRRVRLHLQTNRFLARHLGDAIWEEACGDATRAVEHLLAGMPALEMDTRIFCRRPLRRAARRAIASSHSGGRPALGYIHRATSTSVRRAPLSPRPSPGSNACVRERAATASPSGRGAR
jgi:hypothetical protein